MGGEHTEKTALKQMEDWISTYDGIHSILSFRVDFLDRALPGTGGAPAAALTEVERRRDVMGNVSVINQYHFVVYCVLPQNAHTGSEAQTNANWVMEFQRWVQEQSLRGLAPTFGDDASAEKMSAQNGTPEEQEGAAGTTYLIQLAAQFKKYYEVK